MTSSARSLGSRPWQRGAVSPAAVPVAVRAPDPAQQNAEQLVGIDRLGDVIVHAGVEAELRSEAMALAVMAMIGKALDSVGSI